MAVLHVRSFLYASIGSMIPGQVPGGGLNCGSVKRAAKRQDISFRLGSTAANVTAQAFANVHRRLQYSYNPDPGRSISRSLILKYRSHRQSSRKLSGQAGYQKATTV